MIQNFEEYSIIMLKPFLNRTEMKKLLYEELFKNGISVVKERESNLTKQEIIQSFYRISKDYINYLMSDSVEFFLVKGLRPHDKLYDIKQKIRKYFNVTHCIKNGIHTVDQGNEYHIFLKKYFPELASAEYCNLMDMNMCYNRNIYTNFNLFINALNQEILAIKFGVVNLSFLDNNECRIIKNYKTINITLWFSIYVYTTVCNRKLKLALIFSDADLIDDEVLMYRNQKVDVNLLSKLIEKYDLYVYVDSIEYDLYETERYFDIGAKFKGMNIDSELKQIPLFSDIYEINKIGLDGMFCFKPGRKLVDTEIFMDMCRLLNINEGGGSSGSCKIGDFSVSIQCRFDL